LFVSFYFLLGWGKKILLTNQKWGICTLIYFIYKKVIKLIDDR